jgi:hypothetical protein
VIKQEPWPDCHGSGIPRQAKGSLSWASVRECHMSSSAPLTLRGLGLGVQLARLSVARS